MPNLVGNQVSFSKSAKGISFALTEDLVEQIHLFEKQMDWKIFDILRILKEKKADSLSITKEKPFNYFYARLSGKNVIIRLESLDKQTEFKIPIEKLR